MVRGDPCVGRADPSRLSRFRELVQIGDGQLDVDFTGWNKFVLLSPAVCVLVSREAPNVEWFDRKLAAYRALEPADFKLCPDFWGNGGTRPFIPIGSPPFPDFLVLTQPKLADLFDQLGRTIARWRELAPPEVAGSRPPAHRSLRQSLAPSCP